MHRLVEISNGYYELFIRTGKPKFFVLARNTLKLYQKIVEHTLNEEQDMALVGEEIYDIEWTN